MIVYCCTDLIFATKIASTAQSLGLAARPARDAEMLSRRLNQVDDGKGNGPVGGVVVDLEMGEAALALIRQTKTHGAATPVAAFGSHVAVDMLQAAQAAGADFVMPRSQFTAQLPEILRRMGREADASR